MLSIIGHEQALSFFDLLQRTGRLGHAYCFAGSEHIGKRLVAESIAASVLQIDRGKLVTHPDFFLLAPALDEKTGRVKDQIEIEAVREVRVRLTRRPLLGQRAVAIIDEADRMNAHASSDF